MYDQSSDIDNHAMEDAYAECRNSENHASSSPSLIRSDISGISSSSSCSAVFALPEWRLKASLSQSMGQSQIDEDEFEQGEYDSNSHHHDVNMDERKDEKQVEYKHLEEQAATSSSITAEKQQSFDYAASDDEDAESVDDSLLMRQMQMVGPPAACEDTEEIDSTDTDQSYSNAIHTKESQVADEHQEKSAQIDVNDANPFKQSESKPTITENINLQANSHLNNNSMIVIAPPFSLDQQLQSLSDAVAQMEPSQQHELTSLLRDTSSVSTSSANLIAVAQRTIEQETWCDTSDINIASDVNQKAPEKSQSQSNNQSSNESSNGSTESMNGIPPLHISGPLLLVHTLHECFIRLTIEPRTSSEQTSASNNDSRKTTAVYNEMLPSLGQQLGKSILRDSNSSPADFQAALIAIRKTIECVFLKGFDPDLRRSLDEFFRAVGLACPPFMLYCLLHVIDTYMTRFIIDVDSSHDTSPIIQSSELSESKSSESGLSPALDDSVTALDFMENVYQLCKVVQWILRRQHEGGVLTPSTQSLTYQVCDSHLRASFGQSWSELWQQRFVQRWQKDRTLAIMQPLLMQSIWAWMAFTNIETQLKSVSRLSQLQL